PDRSPTLVDRTSHAHRKALALVDMATRSATTGPTNPTSTGAGATVVVHIDLDTLQAGLHDQSVHHSTRGVTLAPDTIRRLACNAGLLPVVFDGAGQPVDVGRRRRLATTAQRHAVTARDKGCVICGLAPQYCQIHHLDPWASGGSTDIADLALLCPREHRLVHELGH